MERGLPRRRVVLTVAACVLALAAALLAGRAAAGWRDDTRPALTSALASVPASTVVLGFTDWSRLRSGPLDAEEARRRDVLTRSVLDDSRAGLRAAVGWDVRDLDWEAYAQSQRVAVDVVGVRAGFDWDRARRAMRAGGWTGDGDRWRNDSAELVARGLSDVLAEVRLVPSRGVIVLGDLADGADAVVDVVEGRARSLTSVRGAAGTAQALAGSDAVLLQRGDLACEAAAMPDDDTAAQARAAQARAGRLATPRWTGRAITDRGGLGASGQQMRFATTFASVRTAREQLGVRAALARGPFIGRTGDVEDTLRLRSATADGATAVLTMDHDPETDVFMTGTGPVLFAGC